MGQGKSTCSFEARESESQNKRKRSSTSLPIGEGQRRVRGRPDSPRARPTLFQPSALDFRSKTLCSDASHSKEAHVPSALLMAASSNTKRNYHVFLSFRGPDVRQGFLSHLYAALDQQGIYTFVDSEELRKGEEISPALMRAIEESHVAIIVFSENYASSRWCLEELLKIMECNEQNDLIVFPVFYKVEPREVRKGRESYWRAMAEHESKFGKDSEKVKRWKKALSEAGSLSGWELNDRNEAELIKCILDELSIHLNRSPLHVAKYPVGIDFQVRQILSLSKKESDDDDVLMIGLWGPGGIGKTSIATALYNAMMGQFEECHSFLAQVREKSSRSDGLVTLQKDLLSEILVHPFTVYSVAGGISLIQERLCCKKVLLVLDDVDHMNQLNALAGKGTWFGKGSRIIVTSRDKQLLTSHGINCVYEIQTLGYREAQDLFSLCAFPNSKSVEIRSDLIHKALHYADGLPLALEVLGSFLRGRKEPAWESTLHKLSKIPEPTINRVLKISFDGLDDNEREIFLDIACFFKGNEIEYIQEVLDSCDFNSTIGIEILIERSLIKNERGYLQMHDLVQLMGTNIVKQECRDDPGKRSRLWLLEDVEDIFYHNTGTDAVKAMVLNLAPPEAIIISPDAFANMKRLRILILVGGRISSQAQVRLPNELRWLEWSNAPNLEFGSGPKKLVRLDVWESHIKQFTGNFQNFRKLKSIDLHICKSLVKGCELLQEIPPLPPNINKLSAPNCKSLQKLPDLLWDSGDSTSCLLFREGVNMDDVANESWLNVIINGREMPKWIQPWEEDSISFMIPQDLYDEIKGLAICVVLSPEEGKVVDVLCGFTVLVNGQEAMAWEEELSSIESDHVWLYYDLHFFEPSVKELLQNDWSHFQVYFDVEHGSIKKRGIYLTCEQKEDDLRVVFLAPPADGSNVNASQKKNLRKKLQLKQMQRKAHHL